jgi:hypothetical protein
MPKAKFTLNNEEVQSAIAEHLSQRTGFTVMPEEVAFYDASETDNPNPSREIDVSVSATSR